MDERPCLADGRRSLQHAREVKLLRSHLGEVKRAPEAFGSRLMLVQPPVQLADHSMQEVMRRQSRERTRQGRFAFLFFRKFSFGSRHHQNRTKLPVRRSPKKR
jgi:hypothetical protein